MAFKHLNQQEHNILELCHQLRQLFCILPLILQDTKIPLHINLLDSDYLCLHNMIQGGILSKKRYSLLLQLDCSIHLDKIMDKLN